MNIEWTGKFCPTCRAKIYKLKLSKHVTHFVCNCLKE